MRPYIFPLTLAATFTAASSSLVSSSVAAPAGKRLTLSGAIETALAQSPDLEISEKGVESARARLRSSQRRRLPTLSVESQALYWNEELAFGIGIPGMELPPGVEGGEVVVRDQITTSTSVTATQPLSHQIAIGKLVAADRHGLAAAKYDHAEARLQVAADAARAYLNVLLAQATLEIAESRTKLVEAQLERARVLQEGGVLGKVDVMRLEAALAQARREAITARAGAASAEDALVLVLGLPDGTDLEVVDDLPPAAAAPIGPDEAVRQATLRRPDLRAARERAGQARAGAEVEKADLLPSLVALGTFQYNTGGGEFQPKSAWFAGLALSWNFWDWGTTWNEYKAASYRADQAELSADRTEDALRVEVRRVARDTQAAYEALEVARAGLAAAEEAFRIQEARFAEGASTTTDLLSAETEVTRARIAYATARVAYHAQLATLAQATGQLPNAFLPASGRRESGTP